MTAARAALSQRTTDRTAARTRLKPKGSPAPEPSPQGGPAGEFAELYSQHFSKVFAYVYGRVQDKELSLDIVSDIFEKAFIKIHALRSPDAFGPWLFTIARNEVSSYWRKEKPAATAVQEAARQSELIHQPRGPEDTLLRKERIKDLSVVLRTLPQREQEIISLKFDAELTNREIAQVLKTSEVNVRVTVFRALRKLRGRIQVAGSAGR